MLNVSKKMVIIVASTLVSSFAFAQSNIASVQLGGNLNTAALATKTAASSTLQIKASTASQVEIGNLELLKSIGRYEKDLLIYKSVKPSQTELKNRFQSAEKFAQQAGMKFSGEVSQIDENRLALRSAEDASASFEVDQLTGNFLFESGLAKYGSEANTKGLPSDKALHDLSMRVLKEFDLPVKPEELRLAHIGGLNMGSVKDGGESVIFEKLKTVRYSRVLNGLPVMGDGRIVVHYGENGMLSGLIYQIPQIGAASLLSSRLIQKPEQLQAKALEELSGMAKKATRSNVKEVSLVMYDDGRGVMEPAYYIAMERYMDGLGKEPVMIPYDFYLPISSNPIAFFPHMDTSLFIPERGESTEKVDVGTSD